MPLILGLDPSIKKAGFCVLDTEAPYDSYVEAGRLRTDGADGILIQRLIKQRKQIGDLMDKYDIKFVSMEAPYLDGNESEHLFALNQFLHEAFLQRGTYVICFPPQQLKHLACPGLTVNNVHKPQMIEAARELFNLRDRSPSDDEADAMHAANVGKHFWNWHFAHKESDKGLPKNMLEAFSGKHTFTRGMKAGATEYYGLIYRENQLFFDFKLIAERKELYGLKEEVSIDDLLSQIGGAGPEEHSNEQSSGRSEDGISPRKSRRS